MSDHDAAASMRQDWTETVRVERLTGTPGTSVDDLELHPAAIDLT